MPDVARGFLVGTGAFLRSFLRERLTVVLLLVLPPLVVVAYGEAMGSIPSVLVPNAGDTGRIAGTLFSTAFLAGLVGLFQVLGARSADGRLSLAGYPRVSLFGARLATILVIAVVAAGVSFGVLWQSVSVEAPVVAFGSLVLGGLIYGLLGMLVGSLFGDDLQGSLVLVFVADLDAGLSTDLVDFDSVVVEALPLHHPHLMFTEAVNAGTLATDSTLIAGGYALVLLVAAGVVYARTTGEGGLA